MKCDFRINVHTKQIQLLEWIFSSEGNPNSVSCIKGCELLHLAGPFPEQFYEGFIPSLRALPARRRGRDQEQRVDS
jgi:hypothetical protein